MMSSVRTRLPSRALAVAVLILGAAILSGCSSVVDAIPTAAGGLPEGVPARPADPPPYPAVHDVPTGRGGSILSAAEKKLLQDDLIASRERAIQQGATATTEATGTAGKP
jgi:hypothetical protein